jgi:hypothetical protein
MTNKVKTDFSRLRISCSSSLKLFHLINHSGKIGGVGIGGSFLS